MKCWEVCIQFLTCNAPGIHVYAIHPLALKEVLYNSYSCLQLLLTMILTSITRVNQIKNITGNPVITRCQPQHDIEEPKIAEWIFLSIRPGPTRVTIARRRTENFSKKKNTGVFSQSNHPNFSYFGTFLGKEHVFETQKKFTFNDLLFITHL